MITLCWAAKGGSGTTVVAASTALANRHPTLLVDLDRDQPLVLGIAEPDSPGRSRLVGIHRTLVAPCFARGRRAAATSRCFPAATGAPQAPSVGTNWPSHSLPTHAMWWSTSVRGRRPKHSWLLPNARGWSHAPAISPYGRPLGRRFVQQASYSSTSPGTPCGPPTWKPRSACRSPPCCCSTRRSRGAVDSGLLVSRLPSGLTRKLRQAA